jgi:hypothetical protein
LYLDGYLTIITGLEEGINEGKVLRKVNVNHTSAD